MLADISLCRMCGNLCCGNIGLWSDLVCCVCCPSQHCETFISLNDILHTACTYNRHHSVYVSHICCAVQLKLQPAYISVWGSKRGLIMITNMALFWFEWYWCIFNLSHPTKRIDIIFTSAWVEHSVEIPAFCSNIIIISPIYIYFLIFQNIPGQVSKYFV